ncbi:hypothetical protein [Echinicola sp. 20G]|uniref:hypothetical protein n=1 Tax=Echinicola sp. 20G TaxID=2781961 RepID=UPI001910E246|nr:hypothetical protein [Echinicola sp. 20G]
MKENLRLDRKESTTEHHYNQIRGEKPPESFKHEGFVKCKLIHSKGKSFIVPDLIYLMTDDINFEWIQFYSFLPCMLTKFSEEEIIGSFPVDISFGHTIRITITTEWHQHNLPDNSNLFKCRIEGPENIMDFTTGKGKLIDGSPYIELFHHTLTEYKNLIEESSFFKCSAWNYQGTKELSNFAYCYFTSLPEIIQSNDLKMIAMASDGKVHLIVDGSDEIVEIEVYRESTKNRTATLKMLIDSTIIENNHLWDQETNNGQVYYEKSNAFVYRIGVEVGSTIQFVNKRIDRQECMKLLKYLVIGDARTKEGIIASFDEEETEQIFKVELFPDNSTNILKFWFENGNTDLYTRKEIEELKIKSS